MPDPEKMLRDNFVRIINYATPGGTQRQDELEKKRREEMSKQSDPAFEGAEEAGWGKARQDITRVKDHVKPPSEK